jgi:hypothetical protein
LRAYIELRTEPQYRRAAFVEGLQRVGYTIVATPPRPIRGRDLAVIWNRYGYGDLLARRYEQAGARVIVAENGYLGRDWRGEHWYALACHAHNGAGTWPDNGPARWDALNVALEPWRTGREIVVLGTRHIGPEGIREPPGWAARMCAQLQRQTERPVRLRVHPGESACVPLASDLADAWAVVTWGSGAALKALAMGVPVFFAFPRWIGAPAARRIERGIHERAEVDRLPMFRRLAWAMWRTDEIAAGEPFRCLLA